MATAEGSPLTGLTDLHSLQLSRSLSSFSHSARISHLPNEKTASGIQYAPRLSLSLDSRLWETKGAGKERSARSRSTAKAGNAALLKQDQSQS